VAFIPKLKLVPTWQSASERDPWKSVMSDIALNLLEDARRRHRAGFRARAARLCSRILRDHPDHADALELLGTIRFETGQTVEAAELLTKAAGLNPGNAPLWVKRGEVSLRLGRSAGAKASFRRAVLLGPGTPEASNGLAGCMSAPERTALLRRCLVLSPLDKAPRLNHGQDLQQRGNFMAAANQFRSLLIAKPGDPDGLFQYANAVRDLGDGEAAATFYLRTIAVVPRSGSARNNLGLMAFERDEFERAEEWFAAAAAAAPGLGAAWANHARALQKLDRDSEALAPGRKAVMIEPGDQAACCDIAWYLPQSDWARRALTLGPQAPQSYNRMAVLAARDPDRKGELSWLRRGAIADPRDAQAWYSLGVERGRDGDPETAIRYYTRATRIEDGHAPARSSKAFARLAGALMKHSIRWTGVRRDAGANHLERDYEAALRHFRVLHEAFPEVPVVAYRLASLLIGTGRHDEAVRFLEQLLETMTDDSLGLRLNIQDSMARVLYVRGEFDRAVAVLEQILARAPEDNRPVRNKEQGMIFGSTLALLSRTRVNAGDYAEAVRAIEAFPHALKTPFLNNTLERARALLRDGPPSQSPDARPVVLDQLTVACVKHGTKYGADYVNRLYSMVRRHLPGNWRFVCLTDDPRGIRPEVGLIDITSIQSRGWWAKLALFDPQTPLADQTVFYLDLDTVIVGDLGFIEGLKVGFYVLEHAFTPNFNSSVMLFDRTFAAPLHQRFRRSDLDRLVSDQDWLEECLPGIDTFPRGPIRLYKSLEPDLDSTGLARTGAKLVTFPTEPKPHQISHGWVTEHWR
jgi:tetratricopeptide (TPR) repeat protein